MPEGQFGRYQLIEKIGRGGFATVWKARDKQLSRIVALKVLHETYSHDPLAVERFQYEAKTVAALKHPNIITIYDVTKIERQPAIVMEYLPEGSLKEWLTNNKPPLSLTQALALLEPLAKAIDHAHQHGLVHRDIKPSNVMLEKTEAGLRVVLTDFGLVKAVENDSFYTHTGVMFGSPEYMSPEQADYEGKAEVGSASDLYSLGVLAYLLLVGRLPYAGSSRAVMLGHTDGDVPSPQSHNPALTSGLSNALVMMLSKQTFDRFPTASSFVEALQHEEPIVITLSPSHQPRYGLLIMALLAFVGLVFFGLSMLGGDEDSEPTPVVVMVDDEGAETTVALITTTTPTPTQMVTPTQMLQPTYTITSTRVLEETPTATLTLTAAPTATLIPKLEVVVVFSSIGFRSGPSIDYPTLAIPIEGDILTVIARNDENTWYLTQWQMTESDLIDGWVSIEVVQPLETATAAVTWVPTVGLGTIQSSLIPTNTFTPTATTPLDLSTPTLGSSTQQQATPTPRR